VRARTPCRVRTCTLQGGLSRNKVAVGESAAGSPPKHKQHQPDADKPIQKSSNRKSFQDFSIKTHFIIII
jgi:hypothetical protein